MMNQHCVKCLNAAKVDAVVAFVIYVDVDDKSTNTHTHMPFYGPFPGTSG